MENSIVDELQKIINELRLQLQQVEARVTDLEEGNFGTGIYLDGCSESDAEYIKDKTKKAGE